MNQRIIQSIPLAQILGGENIRKRYDEEKVAGLSQSMRESGLREPIHLIRLSGDRYTLLTGGRRLRAARKAGWDTIPAIIEQVELSKGDVLVLQIIENVQREDLKPSEKARAFDALMKETGWNASQVAAKLGLTNGTVSKLLSLLSLPEELQARIDAGEVPATAGYQLSKLDDPEEQNRLATQVASGELTRDKVSDVVKSKKRRRHGARKPRPIRVTAKLDSRETVSVAADLLDLNSFVVILQKLLSHAEQARSDGMTLDGLLKRLASTKSSAPAESRAA